VGFNDHLDRFLGLGHEPETKPCFCQAEAVGNHLTRGQTVRPNPNNGTADILRSPSIARQEADAVIPEFKQWKRKVDSRLKGCKNTRPSPLGPLPPGLGRKQEVHLHRQSQGLQAGLD